MSSEGRMTGWKRIKAMALARKAIKWNEPRKFKFVFNVKILEDDVNCRNTNLKWRYWSSQWAFQGQLYHLHYSVGALVFNIPFWRVLSVSKACACFNVAEVHWSPPPVLLKHDLVVSSVLKSIKPLTTGFCWQRTGSCNGTCWFYSKSVTIKAKNYLDESPVKFHG